MKIREILRRKGTDVVTVGPEVTVLDAMRLLVDHNIGSVVVVDGGKVRGILTERDILRLGAGDPADLDTTRVEGAMTADLVVVGPDDDMDYCRHTMTEHRIRHLPVMEGDDLLGIVSIGDIVKAARRDALSENQHLKQYIRGEVR